jgi:uncharacterized protein YuzE
MKLEMSKTKRNAMANQKQVKIWYDPKGDYLEVVFAQKAGYFTATENDAIMEKVDDEGNVIGFSILKVSELKEHGSLSLQLPAAEAVRPG